MDGSCPWSQKWVYATGWQKEEDGKTLVCDKGDGGITRVFFRDLHLTFNFFLLFYKRFFKGVWSLVGGYFKQNNCHTCHTRFAVVFPFPPCRVSLLKTDDTTVIHMPNKFPVMYYENNYNCFLCFVQKQRSSRRTSRWAIDGLEKC